MAEQVNENAKYKAISGRLLDYFGFKLSDDGSILSGETVCCMTCNKCFARNMVRTCRYYIICLSIILVYSCIKLTKINYWLIVGFKKLTIKKILIVTSPKKGRD